MTVSLFEMVSPTLRSLGKRALDASRALAQAGTEAKNAALLGAAELLVDRCGEILDANRRDVEAASAAGETATVLDRLRLSPTRVQSMASALREVAGLEDPVGEVIAGWVRPNGLRVSRVRVPLGVVGVIYENRPNVTSDAAALCLKSGNASLLRGSAGALRSNVAIASVLREAIAKAGLPEDSVAVVTDVSHESARDFMRMRDCIDLLVPRGGPNLVEEVVEHATVPYVIDGDGNCHVYVDESADLDMALDIVVNAKTQRPSVCNAAESLVVHETVAEALLPRLRSEMEGVELLGDGATRRILEGVGPATDDDYSKEFLGLRMTVKVVDSLDSAIEHIRVHGSGHSEAIVTSALEPAERFCREVDAAAVLVNASTRFVDGGELGLGAEIGISTQKLHARGPMGLRELTTLKYVVRGMGQVRR
jgi:glutamate-5-semialdehyde dehydrogenase